VVKDIAYENFGKLKGHFGTDTKNTHVQYECSSTYISKDMIKIKGFKTVVKTIKLLGLRT
jgi:hypothetical protein